ncbi:unnamed protein product [Phyllotreta striolata]|uniref:Uncharacterized protein n=1 Tax=Phyllotreta striolata TaxID=444603 RepID=A0A9P0GU20_PHYSR|nr:unnamed protein product [Phyllotreta striolata]
MDEKVANLDKLEETEVKIPNKRSPPKDKYFIAAILLFFLGLVNQLPTHFFLVASDYWMYKFRDPKNATYDLDHKTYYQKMFISVSLAVPGFPCLLAAYLSAKFAFRIEVRTRFLMTLGIISFFFVAFTLCIKINTDAWQTEFFVASIFVITVISLCHPLYNVTMNAFMSKFPSGLIKMTMYGSAMSGIASTCLQIFSISISHNSTDIAMIYFSLGSVLILFTLFLCYVMNRSPVVQYYWLEDQGKHVVPSHTLKDFKNVAVQIWPLILILVIKISTTGMGHSNITNLVVSQGYEDHKDELWYSKYFTPTVTYLGYSIFSLIGRFFGHAYITRKNSHWFIILTSVRAFVLGPMFLFCNAQPRHHLPVIFKYDFEYMILLYVYGWSESFIMTTHILSTPTMSGDQSEVAFVLIQVVSNTMSTIASFVDPFYVKLL